MVRAFVRWVLRWRLAWFAVLLASMVAAMASARHIRVGFQFRDFYMYPGSPVRPEFERFTEDFGDPGGYIAILIQAKDVFEPAVLEYVNAISRELDARPEFFDIKSLSTVNLIRADDGGDVASGPVMDAVPATQADADRLRRIATGSGLLRRRLVSPDGTATAVLANMRIGASRATVAQQREAVAAVRQILSHHDLPPGVEIRVSGQPVVETVTTDTLLRDLANLTPITLTVLTLALFVVFRSVVGVLQVLATVTVSIVWTAGIFAWFGRPVDIVGSIIPTILLVYGAVDPIFVLTRYLRKRDEGYARELAIELAMDELALPCFLTSVTTALGFAAFATGTLPTVRNFGIALAIGVMLAFVTTVIVLPLLLSLTPARAAGYRRLPVAGVLDGLLIRLWSAIRAHPKRVLALAAIAVALGAGASQRLTISNEYVGELPKGEALDATRALEQKLSGVVRLAVFLQGPAHSLEQPGALQRMESVSEAARGAPFVDSSISLADVVAEANEAFEGGDRAQRRVPESKSLIAQYLAIMDPVSRADFVNGDYSEGYVLTTVTDHGCAGFQAARDVLERSVASAGFEKLGIRPDFTGNGVLGCDALHTTVVEILWGFVYAFAIVMVLEWVLFRSFLLAAISVVPNLIPVGSCFIIMVVLGLHFRIDNALFLCVSIGGLFNTTIHLIARVVQQARAGARDADTIIGEALRAVGPPSVFTAAVLSMGFAVLLASGFSGLRELGMLSMATLITACAADAVLTPTLVRVVFPMVFKPRASPAMALVLDVPGAPGAERHASDIE